MKLQHYAALAAVLAAIAVVRVVCAFSTTAQGFDEPCHVSAAIEWLDKHAYTLDPVHPPLSRVAIGLPLYLAGERYPHLDQSDPNSHNYNVVGNAILYGSGHYQRNLVLARLGVLPFFLFTIALVFLWTRREFGNFAAFLAVGLFSTLPTVLAFSGLAYTDIPTACTQFAALFAFTCWLQTPTVRASLLLGGATALALLTKLTSFLFLPAVVIGILLCRWYFTRRTELPSGSSAPRWFRKAILVGMIAVLVFWAGYGFSIGRVQETMQLSPDSMPSFQHFPAPIRVVARNAIHSNWIVPVPAFLRGLAIATVLNNTAPPAYLLGHVKNGGWWYFFLVSIAVKAPIAFLILCSIGLLALAEFARAEKWTALAPAVSVAAILIATMSVKYYSGVRHVMVMFPLLAMVAAAGAAHLWQLGLPGRLAGKLLLLCLLAWHVHATVTASSDFLAYFNEFVRDPSKALVAGCDLDCGQDVLRLSQALQERKVQTAHIALWSSADMTQMGLPPFDVLAPFQPVRGWVAVSSRARRLGCVFHETYPLGAFAWLNGYHPVALVGKTIELYYIPD